MGVDIRGNQLFNPTEHGIGGGKGIVEHLDACLFQSFLDMRVHVHDGYAAPD